jgi:UDP-3-O-[3-hydroxymyristoyl] glucosamine N-acyltransferase
MIGAEIAGDESIELKALAGIEEAVPGDLAFIANKKYLRFLETTRASAVIAASGTTSDRVTLLLHPDPYFAFMKAVALFHPQKTYAPFVHPSAVIAASATIHETAHIGPNVVIDDGVTVGKRSAVLANTFLGEGTAVGDDCLIYPNVTLRERSSVGDRVIIHSGTVIGSDGFGYATSEGKHYKIFQVGHVVIEDDVEIGANVAIDRATLGETRIGRGTKIDNLVQVAHNVRIGEGCILVSQVGVSGSTKLGKYVVLGGQVGLVGHIELGDGVQVGAQSGVARSVEAGKTVFGSPARDISQTMKIEACLRKLPEHIKLLRELDKKVSGTSSDDD